MSIGARPPPPPPKPEGVFQAEDVRCPGCKALLFRGILVGEIVCRKCRRRLTFPLLMTKESIEAR